MKDSSFSLSTLAPLSLAGVGEWSVDIQLFNTGYYFQFSLCISP